MPGQGRGPRDSHLGRGHRGIRSHRDRARPRGGRRKREAPDMLFAGVQSSDQAFASTGIATAAFLDWPHAAVVSSLELYAGREDAPCSAASSRAACCTRSRSNARRCSPSSSASTRRATPRCAASSRRPPSPSRSSRWPTCGLTRRRCGRGGLALARAAHVHSREGPRAAHRGRCRASRPRASPRSFANSKERRHERHPGHRRAAARRTAPRLAGAHRRRARPARATATQSRWRSSRRPRSASSRP